jgi:hypothetical protein
MAELRDYRKWHEAYDDPQSGLSWRLKTLQAGIRAALAAREGPVRILSVCAGDGRDVLEVLATTENAERVTATLVEVDPELTARAEATAQAAGLVGVAVRCADAGNTDAFLDAVPADVVLLVGIFGNISPTDIRRTIDTAPALCSPGGTLFWSRGRDRQDLNDDIRSWFAAAGFVELDYQTHDSDRRPSLGAVRYAGEPQQLRPGQPLFTFIR